MKFLFKSVLSFLIVFLFCTKIFSQDFQKCGTFSPENLSKVGQLCTRPTFYPSSSEVQIIPTTNFDIHFITDEIPPLNPNDPPSDKTTWAYAEKVAEAVQEAWNFQVNSLGWQGPPGDGTCGGGLDKYDIYIKRVNFYGETQKEVQVIGSNGFTSYITVTTGLMRNNIFLPLTEEELNITLAHEFNHAVQFGYNGTKPIDPNSWFLENTSTWIEEIQYPEINDWITTFLNNPNAYSPLNRPFLPIDHWGNDYQYNGALFCHMLSRWFGNQFIRDIWQYAANSNNLFLSDINNVLISRSTNLKNALKKYAVWRFYTGARDDGNHFPKGHLYNFSKILREHNTGIGSGSSSPDDLSSKGGTSYIVFKNGDGVIDITFNGQDSHEFSVIAINRRSYFGDTENSISLNTQNDGTIQNLSCIGDDEVVLIPIVTDWQSPLNTDSYSYSSNYGQGISTSFWTEKESYNLNGALTLQRSSLINSGSSKNLANQLDYNVFTNEERFLSIGGKNVKHNRWNDLTNKNFLNQQFRARNDNNRQSAKYENIEYSRIESRLEGQLIQDKGEFEFNDPWYVKSDLTQPGNHWIQGISYYEPNGKHGAVEKGVFLDQGLTPQGQWVPPYYSVKAMSPQPVTLYNTGVSSGRSHNFYFQNWSGTEVQFENANNPQTGLVFKDEITGVDPLATAKMKGTQLSSDQNAYFNNSQRKFVRANNTLVSVYESGGKVWIEFSRDGGLNWELGNLGKPLFSGTEAKNPAIEFINIDQYWSLILVVAQVNRYGQSRLATSLNLLTPQTFAEKTYEVDGGDNGPFSINTYPSIAMVGTNWFMTSWVVNNPQQNNSFLDFLVWEIVPNLGNWSLDLPPQNQDFILHDGTQIRNMSLYSAKPDHPQTQTELYPVWIAYEEEENNQFTKIYAGRFDLDINNNYHLVTSGTFDVSSGSGFNKNIKPSILAILNGTARLCWIGYRSNRDEEVELDVDGMVEAIANPEIMEEKRVEIRTIFKSTDYYRYWNFGDNVTSVNINKSDDLYTVAWARGNNLPIQYTDSRYLSAPFGTLNFSANDIQLSNGVNSIDMRLNGFNSQSIPRYFTCSRLYLPKSEIINIASGREGVISKDSAQFFFAFGDIKLNGQLVEFADFDDTVSFYNNNRLNQFLSSEPFNLNDNSNFVYSIQYGITDSSAAVYILDNDDYINFKVELRDDQTDELLGLFDNITYNDANVMQYENIAYQVNTQGIGNRSVRLKLVTGNNFDPKYSLTDRYAENNALLKSTVKQISYQGSLAVDNYDLSQNYPNPFNPTTTINYQIKEDGLVTLKLYDILGAEVKTLVNEEKSKGRYVQNFDGSDLASGVYIYQLRVNDFVSSKKQMLLK